MSYAIPSLTRVPATEKGLTIGDFLVPIRLGERTSPRIRDEIGAYRLAYTSDQHPRSGAFAP